jgi:hypothetical protein
MTLVDRAEWLLSIIPALLGVPMLEGNVIARSA